MDFLLRLVLPKLFPCSLNISLARCPIETVAVVVVMFTFYRQNCCCDCNCDYIFIAKVDDFVVSVVAVL